jgi:hypothetical protein
MPAGSTHLTGLDIAFFGLKARSTLPWIATDNEEHSIEIPARTGESLSTADRMD